MRILHVLGDLEPGGIQSFLDNLFDSALTRDIVFDFVVHSDKKTVLSEKFVKNGSRVFFCPKFGLLQLFSYRRWWNSFFLSHPEYRIVHGHIRSTAFIYLREAKKRGLVTIFHSHSTSNGTGFLAFVKDFLQKRAVKYSDYLFACSKEAGVWLFGEKNTCKSNFYIVPDGVLMEKYLFSKTIRVNERAQLGIGENVILLGTVGRLVEAKNQSFLLPIFNEFCKRNPNSMLLIVGDGPEKETIQKKIMEMGIAKKVILFGGTSKPWLFYQAMDCFVFPSKWEGFGMAPLEAQMSGLPCLISDHCPPSVFIAKNAIKEKLSAQASVWAEDASRLLNQQGSRSLSASEKDALSRFDISQTSVSLCDFYVLCSKKRDNVVKE